MKILYLFLVMILISGCSNITHRENQQNNITLDTENSINEQTKDFNTILNSEEYNFPVPADIGKLINCNINYLSTIIKNKQTMIDYYSELERNNWKPLRTKSSGAPISVYFNGRDGLIITESMLNDEESWEVVINYYEGKDNASNKNEFDDKIKLFLSDEHIYAISEYDLSEATEELGLRGFYAFTDKMEPTKIVIDKYGEIVLINYDQFLLCDIDSDGEKEFVTRLGYGSGRYVITLSVWKYNHNIKKLELAYRTQYEQLGSVDMFIKEEDEHIEVISGYWDKGNIVTQESYGNLYIKDGRLLFEKKDIPFKLLKSVE